MNSSESKGCSCHGGASDEPCRARRPRVWLLIIGVGLIAGLWLFRAPLRDKIRFGAILANDAPDPGALVEMIEHAAEPHAALVAAWNSGKMVHREVAISAIRQVAPDEQPLPSALESIVLAGALDPDLNVRETALGILGDRKHPALAALAAEQLQDPDPQVRLLGLSHLKPATPAVGVPIVATLLEDPDVAVVAMSLKLLERWTGQTFGAKLADAIPVENPKTDSHELQIEGLGRIRAAVVKAKAWWAEHQNGFPTVQLQVPAEAYAAQRPIPAPDFQLHTLEGKRVRLSDFRGKVVVVNFWTTWCTACVGEIPVLVALHQKHGNHVAILGVSLDAVPDSHGHIGGHASVEEQTSSAVEHESPKAAPDVLKRVREKVARTVRARNINYTVLLDEHNDVGAPYNGGELPTTAIVDAQGRLRRRFAGARPLEVFEAMIAEARQPSSLAFGTLKALE